MLVYVMYACVCLTMCMPVEKVSQPVWNNLTSTEFILDFNEWLWHVMFLLHFLMAAIITNTPLGETSGMLVYVLNQHSAVTLSANSCAAH